MYYPVKVRVWKDVNLKEATAITKICRKFSDIFHREGQPLTFTNQVKHEIKTTDELPCHPKLYRYAQCHQEEINDQI